MDMNTNLTITHDEKDCIITSEGQHIGLNYDDAVKLHVREATFNEIANTNVRVNEGECVIMRYNLLSTVNPAMIQAEHYIPSDYDLFAKGNLPKYLQDDILIFVSEVFIMFARISDSWSMIKTYKSVMCILGIVQRNMDSKYRPDGYLLFPMGKFDIQIYRSCPNRQRRGLIIDTIKTWNKGQFSKVPTEKPLLGGFVVDKYRVLDAHWSPTSRPLRVAVQRWCVPGKPIEPRVRIYSHGVMKDITVPGRTGLYFQPTETFQHIAYIQWRQQSLQAAQQSQHIAESESHRAESQIERKPRKSSHEHQSQI
ncbi:hypothetical protein BGW36DRAFT_423901 [Talaromyces proteolyticus]|uniref:Uncharacterized protein n=1 Tax=Talaromyces proteolyticus TaxID=1131652 RepID=A0AAD4L1N3_9EURO|nr:uncharacterized protein BGW36DRAFT_423901 [Talaromyces proteolyticus]KAH8701594.1 hypothetical protein BGW36DRAFT_423901 [Talaromyces proteolyticus]